MAIRRWDLHRHFFHPARVHASDGLALFIAIVSLIAFVLAAAVVMMQGWARVAALALEAFLVALIVLTFPFHPGLKLLDLIAAGVVIYLLVSDETWETA